MKITALFLAAVLSGVISPTFAAKLNPIEQQLEALVERDNPQAVKLLKQVVNINSGTMNLQGVREVGEVFDKQFKQLGFTTRWIDGKAFQRAGHLYAEYKGKNAQNAPKILMIGHLDTVFSKDSPVQKYIAEDEHHVRGPGIIDMKGGNVIIVHTLKALKDAGLLDQFNIQVIFTGDEEKRGQPIDLAVKALVDSAKWADIALAYENGDNDPKTAVVSRRGFTGWQLTVTGKPAHSSQIFREDMGYGAIFETARILDQFRITLSEQKNLTFNPGLIIGGTEAELDKATARATGYGKQNVIAKITRVSGDLRALSHEQQEKAKQSMARIVARHLPHTRATIQFRSSYPPLAPTEGNYRLLDIYSQASQDLGYGPVAAVDPRRAGAADISFTAGHVAMAMDGLGLMGHSGHTDDETADMRTLPQQTKRSALLLYRLLSVK